MSNKPFEKLTDADKAIRRLRIPGNCGMFDGVLLTIEYFSAFEAFNTRPYHNYESWGQGYRLRTHDGIVVESEDLDDALRLLRARIEAASPASVPQAPPPAPAPAAGREGEG